MINRTIFFTNKVFNDSIKFTIRSLASKEYCKENIANLIVPDDEIVLKATSDWLLMATEVRKQQGVAAQYSFFWKWGESYRETTGYIIPTFLRLRQHYKNQKYLKIALSNGLWLLKNFSDDGGVIEAHGKTYIFNTGQVLHGLVSLYEKTNDKKFIIGILKASYFIVDRQDKDGAFRQDTYQKIEHDYNVRTAWALLRSANVLDDNKLIKAAIKNIEYVIEKSSDSSYPFNANTKRGKLPHTHGIGYTFRGILEAGIFLNNYDFLDWVKVGAQRLQKRFELESRLACYINEKWENASYYDCITGNCQIAIIWLKLAKLYGDYSLLNSAIKMISICKSHVPLKAIDKNVIGGVPGAFPIYGFYAPFSYPNWATKFLIDALIEKNKIMNKMLKTK